MNKLIYTLALSSLVFLFVQCGDPCDDINCLNGGICVEGTCDCAEGYMGVNCETELRANFIGIWIGEYNCTDDETDDALTIITQDPTSVLSLIIEVDGGTFSGVIVNENMLSLPEQTVMVDGSSFNLMGEAELTESNSLLMTLTIQTGLGQSTDCEITGIKQ